MPGAGAARGLRGYHAAAGEEFLCFFAEGEAGLLADPVDEQHVIPRLIVLSEGDPAGRGLGLNAGEVCRPCTAAQADVLRVSRHRNFWRRGS